MQMTHTHSGEDYRTQHEVKKKGGVCGGDRVAGREEGLDRGRKR